LLLQHFSKLDDEREPWRMMYPLSEVLLLLTCATIASCDDFDDIAAWATTISGFLQKVADFHHGLPCERWLRCLVNRSIRSCSRAASRTGWEARGPAGRPDAIDGKTARRSHDRKGLKAMNTLSAYATTARLVLAQTNVPEKANEITAIPALLDQLAEAGQLEGALVTIDAMGCQDDIAAKIVAHKADYLLVLNGNQPTLEAGVTDYFHAAPADVGWLNLARYGLGQAYFIAGRLRQAEAVFAQTCAQLMGADARAPIGTTPYYLLLVCCMMKCIVHTTLGEFDAAAQFQSRA
jgi:hypothetical protein